MLTSSSHSHTHTHTHTHTDTPATPDVGGTRNDQGNDYTWTIVGVVCGFIGGVVIGIILMAFFYRHGNVFVRKERRRRRTSQLYRYDTGEDGSRRKDVTSSSNRRHKSSEGGGTDYYAKEEEFLKNNHDLTSSGSHVTKSNDYIMTPIANGGTPATKFTLNPVPTKGASSAGPAAPIANSATKFTLNPVPTKGAGSAGPAAPIANSGTKFTYNLVPGKGAGVVAPIAGVAAPIAVTPPTAPVLSHKTKSASTMMHVSTSRSRGMTSSDRSNPNLKSNIKLEESLTNHDRQAYGRNILARQPSVDTTNKLANANGRTILHPHPHVLQASYDRHREYVSVADVPRTSSQC